MSGFVKPGTRVSIVDPFSRSVEYARALDTQIGEWQLALLEDEDRKLMLLVEGITWARGWESKAAAALRTMVALS